MKRREFIILLGGAAAAWPLVGHAQQPARLPVVGVLKPHNLEPAFTAFLERLRELGYEEGRNAHLLIRSADAKLEELPTLAAELVRAKVDVIVAINTPGSRAAINATNEIPIVMGIVGNPVATGFVSNLSRPGGNVTGISNMSGELASKRLQVLKEALPAAKRIAVMFNSRRSDYGTTDSGHAARCTATRCRGKVLRSSQSGNTNFGLQGLDRLARSRTAVACGPGGCLHARNHRPRYEAQTPQRW